MFTKRHFFEATPSTNDEATLHLKEGAEEGEVFWTYHQTQGRGRLGRSWESPAGKNLALSFLLRPPLPLEKIPLITQVAGQALHHTLLSFLPREKHTALKIKWPNDIYFHDQKIAGILCEMHFVRQKMHVVCGIGVNINSESDDFSAELRSKTTSLKNILKKETALSQVFEKFLPSFEQSYAEFLQDAQTTVAYGNKNSYLKDKAISLKTEKGILSGIALGLNEEGFLKIRTPAGQEEVILAGEILTETP